MVMKMFRRIVSRFTVRGRALARVDQGMVYAKNAEPDKAIKQYSDVVNSSESPHDVKAMALFNRALVYTSIKQEVQAAVDLKAILKMPGATTNVQRSASDKLVRMERKLKREETAKEKGG